MVHVASVDEGDSNVNLEKTKWSPLKPVEAFIVISERYKPSISDNKISEDSP